LGEEPALKKRVCETCRYFQEAGFAKNGWCNNPQRKESSDVKLVVRRNELACRNGWAQDLWSARTNDQDAADIVLHDTVSVRPVPPASVEEMTFLVNSQRDKTPAPELPPPVSPVDVVVGETPSTKPVSERPSLLVQDPRSAILKARERYRARMAAELRQHDSGRLLVDPLGDTGSPGDTMSPVAPARGELPPAQRPVPLQPRGSDVPPVQISEVPRTFPTITSFPEDEVRFSSVPEPVAGITLPRPESASLGSGATTETTGPRETEPDDLVVSLSATTLTQHSEAQLVVEHEETGQSRRGSQLDVERSLVAAPATGNVVALPMELDEDEVRGEGRRTDAGGWRRTDRRAPARPKSPPPEAIEDVWTDESEALVVGDDVVADLSPVIEIAPDVPRMCRTCRDFRPADSGGRGWCTNKWAFSHRRMVDADELPCETSVGCWWLPHDDIWLATADVSAHGQPTPLVDHWLAHKIDPAAVDAGAQRRRQRS
jgi:hypothetical protein